ncbi:MAG: hypothetical protein KIT84_29215 [Labilithrix sp.]|nr:hypothetical protein [Labilithrix sp.]MCW5815142.1 hypothetical protein [Labilithrix sp.]
MPTRTPFDKLAKRMWSALLERAGTVDTETEVAPDSQSIDLTFEPDAARLESLRRFGLVGRMFHEEHALLEFFHDPPSSHDVLECLAKLTERRKRPETRSSTLWILSAGRPTTAIAKLGFTAVPDWPSGTYALEEDFFTRLIVINELPVERGTLLLRAVGAGRVLRDALSEATALPPDAPERAMIVPAVLKIWGEPNRDEEFAMATQDFVERWERELLEKGQRAGREQAMREVLTRQLRARFGGLDDAVEARIRAAGVDELTRWTDRIITAAALDEVFAEP